MKLRKDAGHDGIEAEHLLYAHPILINVLSILFNAIVIIIIIITDLYSAFRSEDTEVLIVTYSYVPNGFGNGIIIPLAKDKLGNRSDIRNYRGDYT